MTAFEAARDFLLAHREDDAAAQAGFAWPELGASFNWATDWFDAVLARRPESRDRPALWLVDTVSGAESRFSFAELSARSDRVALALRAHGVRRGDRLLLLLGNAPPLWETMLAAMKLGAVVIPATTLLNGEELADRLARGRVRHIVAAADQIAKLAALDTSGVTLTAVGLADPAPGWHRYEDAHEDPELAAAPFLSEGATSPDDPLLLYFTSGTTARPKLVLHSHRSYPVGHLSTMYWLGLMPGDVHLNVSSPGWAKHAYSSFFAPWNAGATILVVNQPRFDATVLLDAVARCGVTTFCVPPTVWRLLVQQDLAARRTSLRELASAGEPLNPEIIEQVQRAWGLTIRDGYGQTETTLQVGNPPGLPVRPGSMGRPAPGYRVILLDPEGNEAASEGEVCLVGTGPDRPAGLMLGYQAAGEDGSGVTAVGELYRTGDIATRDPDGYLTFVGRADDVFKASDYRISPFELESVLIEHEAVAEAAVVPSPDPVRLAVPKAFVALVAGAEPSRELALAIFRYSRRRLPPYKRIRRLELVAELPKTISGKIRRGQLRRAEQGEPGHEDTLRGLAFAEEDFPELRELAEAAGVINL